MRLLVTCFINAWLNSTITTGSLGWKENRVYGQKEIKKKMNHAVAWFITLLLVMLGVLLFTIMVVNSHLPL